MTAKIGSAVTEKVIQRITGPSGLNSSLAALSEADRRLAGTVEPAQIRAQNAASELAERATLLKYPAVNVYCEKITNDLREKFRRFSGTARMSVEVRHSQDRLEELQERLELYVDSVTAALTAARGSWGDGAYYAGGYEVKFGPIKHGGKNFIQAATITFEIGVSKN